MASFTKQDNDFSFNKNCTALRRLLTAFVFFFQNIKIFFLNRQLTRVSKSFCALHPPPYSLTIRDINSF